MVELVRHSDDVLEALHWMSQRHEILAMKILMNARETLNEMIELVDVLIGSEIREPEQPVDRTGTENRSVRELNASVIHGNKSLIADKNSLIR